MSDSIDTHNIYVDKNGKFVSIRVNPRLYRKDIIMRAADDLIHNENLDVDAIVDGDPETEIIVKFIPRESKRNPDDLQRLANKFNSLLVASSGKG